MRCLDVISDACMRLREEAGGGDLLKADKRRRRVERRRQQREQKKTHSKPKSDVFSIINNTLAAPAPKPASSALRKLLSGDFSFQSCFELLTFQLLKPKVWRPS